MVVMYGIIALFWLSGDDMQNIDIEFFSEYKAVERMCKDMYGDDGVKAYIEEMENTYSREKMFIGNWDNKLRTLKHLKWLRNQIAHDNEGYEVTEQDLADIKEFYNELLTQQDPLALLYKEIENTKKRQQEYKLQQQNQKIIQNQEDNTSANYQKDKTSRLKPLAIAAAIAIVILIAIIMFFL